MRTSELKKGVYSAFATARLADRIDEQILSCLVYDLVRRVLESEESQSNDIRSLAESYIPGMVRKLDGFKSSFASYSQMRSEVTSYGHSTFLAFTQQQIARINALYRERVAIKDFSSVYFSQYMYRVSNLRDVDYRRLSSVHRRLMSPIARFYADQYGKRDSDLEIADALLYADKPGKEILFSVRGIVPSRVVADIRSRRIPVRSPEDYSEARVQGKYVRIVTK